METFSAWLAICTGNSPVPGEFPAQRPVTGSFDIFFDLRLNKRLNKQPWAWSFETPTYSLWRQCNGLVLSPEEPSASHWPGTFHLGIRIYRRISSGYAAGISNVPWLHVPIECTCSVAAHVCGKLAPGNNTLWHRVPVTTIQKIFRLERLSLKKMSNLVVSILPCFFDLLPVESQKHAR